MIDRVRQKGVDEKEREIRDAESEVVDIHNIRTR
jgi:hypothetical protein